MNTINMLKVWMRAATPDEQELLAKRIGTSRPMLYHYSNENRQPSVERAIAIERETRVMAKASKGRLPAVMRTDLVAACRSCEYAAKCLGERIVVSEFPIVDERQLGLDL